jgi:myo-inositol 2-dehydrogenase/D-chiro-inositol 1-dehydrogenase
MSKWWVPGLQIGYEHTFIHQLADFLEGLGANRVPGPSFRDALATEGVVRAVLESAKSGAWVDVRTDST